MKQKRFVVTGGAGFIGSCVLWRLNTQGYNNILVVDQIDDERKKKNLENKKFKDYLDKIEFLQSVQAGKYSHDFDCIIHMGACSSTTLQDEAYFKSNNFDYSVALASFALSHNVQFLYASSAATYGDGSQGYSDSDQVTPTLQPLNLYAWSKQQFDMWVLDNNVSDKVAGFKFFNVFGPNEYHKDDMRSVIAKSYHAVKQNGVIQLFRSYNAEYRDGEQKRDFIYVKDAVEIVQFFVEHSDKSGIFNVGTGTARTWNDIACILFSHCNRTPNIKYIDMPATLQKRYQYFTEADLTKLRAAGYEKPLFSLEEAIGEYCSYLENTVYL